MRANAQKLEGGWASTWEDFRRFSAEQGRERVTCYLHNTPSQQNGPAGSEKQSENVNVDQGGFLPYGQKIELDQRTFSVHGLPIWSIASWKGFRTFKEFRYLCQKIGFVAGIR